MSPDCEPGVTRARRGRPPSERSRAAILAATLELLAERGSAGTTIDAVAALACASKATVYRHFVSKEELVVAAVGGVRAAGGPGPDPNEDARAQLVATLMQMNMALHEAPGAQLLPRLVSDAVDNPRLAEVWRARVVEPRREAVADILRQAVDRGELAASVELDLAVDLLMAPLFYRRLLPLPVEGDDYPRRVVDVVWAGLRTASGTSARPADAHRRPS